jgi:hypothetical protein
MMILMYIKENLYLKKHSDQNSAKKKINAKKLKWQTKEHQKLLDMKQMIQKKDIYI